MILAAIDVGTNTIRLMVAKALSDSQISVLWREREIVRLGKGFTREKKVSSKNLERVITVIKKFSIQAQKLKAEKILLFGTSALREACNSKDVQQLLYKETGLLLQIISGKMEAKLTSHGAIQNLGLSPKNMAVIDVGGGSSEFSYFPIRGAPSFLSVPLGAVWLTEKFSPHNSPGAEEYEGMYRFCHNSIKKTIPSFSFNPPPQVIGTGGTATTLAAISQKLSIYDPEKINNFPLSLTLIKELENDLRSLPIKERVKIPGLEKGREDIILAGISLFIAFMKILKVSKMIISDASLLEGIIFQEINPSGF